MVFYDQVYHSLNLQAMVMLPKMFISYPDLVCEEKKTFENCLSAPFSLSTSEPNTIETMINVTAAGAQNSNSVIYAPHHHPRSSPHCLQRSIDDKFRCLEDCEGQVRRLQLALREKERDLERLRCILSNNEETITVRRSRACALYWRPM